MGKLKEWLPINVEVAPKKRLRSGRALGVGLLNYILLRERVNVLLSLLYHSLPVVHPHDLFIKNSNPGIRVQVRFGTSQRLTHELTQVKGNQRSLHMQLQLTS